MKQVLLIPNHYFYSFQVAGGYTSKLIDWGSEEHWL